MIRDNLAAADPAMGDRFIWHDNLLGARYYLYGETRMRYYLPGGLAFPLDVFRLKGKKG